MIHARHLVPSLLAASVAAAGSPAAAQTAETTPSVVVIGSRAAPKSALDTAVPVAYIGQADIAQSPPSTQTRTAPTTPAPECRDTPDDS